MSESAQGISIKLSNLTIEQEEFLLQRLAAHLNDPLNYCFYCEKLCDRFWPFCSSCGKENPAFNKDLFARRCEESLRGYRAKECSNNHPGKKSFIGTEDFDREQPFCWLCGKKYF